MNTICTTYYCLCTFANESIDSYASDHDNFRFPPLPTDLIDKRLSEDTEKIKEELQSIFRGRWYIVGGLN